jgi:FkbM family methyltransferase
MSNPVADRAGLHLDDLDPALARRVRQTVSCTDSDGLPKVPGAGEVVERDGARVQVMHNGVLVEEGGYYGDWMARIITALRGHHEPQEEVVFDALVTALASTARSDGEVPVMVELGSFWAYYSLWFCRQLPGARAYGIEPDPAYLEVGRRNVALNELGDRIVLAPGVVGAAPGSTLQFSAESDGVERPVVQFDLASLMQEHGLEHVDLVLSDIQGWELLLVERALPLLRQGRVRFLLVSTHHHSISGDALTHQKVRDLLVGAGASVIAEHSVGESASGDGLLAVSFDPRDDQLRVEVSHGRARDSLFGELEYDLAAAQASASALREQLEGTQRELDLSQRRTRRLRRRLRALSDPNEPLPGSAPRPSSLGSRLRAWRRRRRS